MKSTNSWAFAAATERSAEVILRGRGRLVVWARDVFLNILMLMEVEVNRKKDDALVDIYSLREMVEVVMSSQKLTHGPPLM